MTNNIRKKITNIYSYLKTVQKSIYIDYGSDYQNTIFLAGTGRSGTTWISNIINYNNEYRYMFEPFHPRYVNICGNFKYKQYLRPENSDEQYIKPARLILEGKVRNSWIDAHNKKIMAHKRLIKDIRSNFLLKWMHNKFPGLKIILALRHPCAVANSRMKLKWNTLFEKFLYDEDLLIDFIGPFIEQIDRAQSDFEKNIFLWCVENYVPLKQFKSGKIHLVFYEHICLNPSKEIKRLFSFLNISYDEAVFSKLSIPSVTSRQSSAIVERNDLVDNWRKCITKDQIQKAHHILKLFGLDVIYSDASLPNIENAFAFMGNE